MGGASCILELETTRYAGKLRRSIAGAQPPRGSQEALEQAGMVHFGDGQEGRAHGCCWEGISGASLLTPSTLSLKQVAKWVEVQEV